LSSQAPATTEKTSQGGYFTIPNSLSGVMSISATGPNDELVFYPNWGTNEIDVAGRARTRQKTNG
jgi:hypothetical protein